MIFRETVEKIGPGVTQDYERGFTTCVQPTPRWDLNAGTVVLNIDITPCSRAPASMASAFYLPVISPDQEGRPCHGHSDPDIGSSEPAASHCTTLSSGPGAARM